MHIIWVLAYQKEISILLMIGTSEEALVSRPVPKVAAVGSSGTDGV